MPLLSRTCIRLRVDRWCLLACLLLFPAVLRAQESFTRAQPVWPEGRQQEMNLHVGFRALIPYTGKGPAITLRLSAASTYRLFVNGSFAGYGPARAPAGFARIDTWPLSASLHPGVNVVAIEVAGYNANSFYIPKQTSFLQAEIRSGNQVLAATGSTAGFRAFELTEFQRRTQRYSFQRPFTEVYDKAPGDDRWRRDTSFEGIPLHLERAAMRRLLPRRLPLPDFTLYPARTLVAVGTSVRSDTLPAPWRDRSLTQVPAALDGFAESTIPRLPSIELQHWTTRERAEIASPLDPAASLPLTAGRFAIADLGLNRAGFPGFHADCSTASQVYLSFDEVLTGGDVDFKRLETVNIVAWKLQPGHYDLESYEPYVAHFVKVMVASGACTIHDIHVRDYSNPDVWQADFAASDPRLNRIFAAARETFRHNSVDLFTDCPSRERAGWTGDSYFTARAAARFASNTNLERNFFENLTVAGDFPGLPAGMLPMLYPGDVIGPDGFIPGYSLWLVLQLAEYAQRSQDEQLILSLRPRILALLRYFDGFRNSDGMLENLTGWVFLEWSDASKYTGGVSFPHNMMYAAALDAVAGLYAMPGLGEQAKELRTRIREMAYDGHFFRDHAIRTDGRLMPAPEHTEAAQYFAFYFGTATPQLYPELWARLQDEFGPDRMQKGLHPDVAPSNVIFGKLLRIELLSRAHRNQQILDESAADFLTMADATGTLWEHIDLRASTDHGLMSHMAFVLYRDVLGISSIDWKSRHLRLFFPQLSLSACSGTIPTPDGPVHLAWKRAGSHLRYHLEMPAGYQVEVASATGITLEAE